MCKCYDVAMSHMCEMRLTEASVDDIVRAHVKGNNLPQLWTSQTGFHLG